MPRDYEEMFEESMQLLWRQMIVFGSDEPAMDKWQIESVRMMILGGVRPQDFAYAVELMQNPTIFFEYEWDFICAQALKRRADINFEIAEAE